MKAYKPVLMAVAAVALVASPAFAQKAKQKVTAVETPTLACVGATQTSINVQVTAGAVTGAPAGFSLQWLEGSDTAAPWPVDWQVTDELGNVITNYCKASFSGNAFDSRYNLRPGESTVVNVGEFLFDNGSSTSPGCDAALACGTTYLFRSFAHATSTMYRSDFSAIVACQTLACDHEESCTLTQGYWKTHGPVPTGNNSNDWAVTSLTLGTVSYTDLELLAIFNKPAAGNGLISLAHQLIAAKLNVANGADGTAVAAAITAADALIGGLVVPPVGTGSLAPSATSALTGTLAAYNEGAIGPGHCN